MNLFLGVVKLEFISCDEIERISYIRFIRATIVQCLVVETLCINKCLFVAMFVLKQNKKSVNFMC
jgi:hypothetical protein